MSVNFENWQVVQFEQNVHMLLEQKSTRLMPTVRKLPNIVGKSDYVDTLGGLEFAAKVGSAPVTPITDLPLQRRRLDIADFQLAVLIDTLEQAKTLHQLDSYVLERFMGALNRKIDGIIAAAFYADAKTGENGSGTASFDSNNVIAVDAQKYYTGSGNKPLTIDKLLQAKEILRGNHVEPDEQIFVACSENQLNHLLATVQFGSSDYNDAQALKAGTANRFMGFNFIQYEGVPLSGSYERAMVYPASAMAFAFGTNPTFKTAERADRSHAKQIYSEFSAGAVRMEEARAVSVLCTVTGPSS